MVNLTIAVDLGVLQAALKDISEGNLPHTQDAVRDVTFLIQRTWLQAASGREMSYQGSTFSLKRVSGEYARSIEHGMQYPEGGDSLAGRVTANAGHAQAIEQGSPARDLKPGLLGGPKARRGKNGSIYTIIPFRHGSPDALTMKAMPREIYAQARRLAHSKITGSYLDQNAHGGMVRRNTYQWGGRLKETTTGWRSRIQPEGHEYTHSTAIFSGMVRMGSPKHSSFMTFRVVSSNSPTNSWWSPGTDPKPVAAAVAEMVSPTAMAMIRTAFMTDLAVLGGE